MVGLRRLSAVDIETVAALEQVRDDIRRVERRLDESAAETRRHLDVVAESFRDDVRMIAEGLVLLDSKVESLRGR